MTRTNVATPMELLGGRSGVSIIDASSILKRLWYFDGRFLRASGFRLDQEYVRSLVALSNQALGHGVVHGYDVGLAGGDRLRVEGGLAIAASGRVVYLPQDVELGIAKLIARSSGELDPGTSPVPGVADFTPCPPDEPADPALTVPPRPLYVLTVAGAEALCGEEERFGHLCEDACATESDRSVAVEGVVFRVRELSLPLPTSRTVPFTNRHLRSRVASAWFAREQTSVPSMISGAGLRAGVWCNGADGVGGEEVALAVLDRTGSVTSLLDMWTARRELVETTPQRYWAARMAMRPWDVFLAQVLQFQCQLLALGGPDTEPGVADPCGDERDALAAANEILGGLAQPAAAPAEGAGHLAFERGAAGIAPVLLQRIEAVRARIAQSLSASPRSQTGSLLLDGGIVEVPSGGYLPVSPQSDVAAQVRALFGPGVDLRFCAVRPDFVPEALQEAQHMERISLTQGIDDPNDLEEVDVLVPDGDVAESQPPAAAGFVGSVRILPRERQDDLRVIRGSALTLTAVARDHSSRGASGATNGWSWSLAGYGEAPQQSSVPAVAEGLLGYFRDVRPAAATPAAAEAPVEAEEVFIRPDSEHDALRSAIELAMRANREAVLSAERRAMAQPFLTELATPTGERIPPDRPIDPRDARPMALWFDIETDEGLDTLAVGARTTARLRLSAYSRARTSPVLLDIRVSGSLVVTQRVGAGTAAPEVLRISTELEGFADPLIAVGVREIDPQPTSVTGVGLEWEIERTTAGVRILRVSLASGTRGARAYAADTGSPRHVTGHVDVTATSQPATAAEWRELTHLAAPSQREARLLSYELDESPGALDPGSPDRDLADAALVLIGTELALPGRDPQFTTFARNRLFGDLPSGPVREIRSSTDWVMFHRRRVKVCGDVLTEQPTRLRRYRWHHAVVSSRADLEAVRALWGDWVQPGGDARDVDFLRVRAPVDGLGFEPVTTLEFSEGSSDLTSSLSTVRSSWGAADRGDLLRLGVVGDIGVGDGETVALARLAAARSAVTGLIDTSRTRVAVLPEVPAEFRGTGLDGVILTVGQQRAPVATECARVLRMSRDDLARLQDALAGRDGLSATLLEEVMAELGVAVDEVRAQFQGDALTNQDEVAAWWNGSSALRAWVLFDRSVLDSGTEMAAWDRHLGTLQTRLQMSNVEPGQEPWELGDCPVAVLIAAVEEPQ